MQEFAGGYSAKLFKGLAEMIDVREVEHLGNLPDGKLLVREEELLCLFDAVSLAKSGGRFAAVFEEKAAEVALTEPAFFGDLGEA